MTRSTHPYGSDPSQLGELFLPSGNGPFAVVVVVHGGYWKAQYDRSLMTDLCLDLAAHGPPRGISSTDASGRGADGRRPSWTSLRSRPPRRSRGAARSVAVVAVGHSAGGQLALWAASRRTLPADAPGADPRVVIGAAVSQAGLLDLMLAAALTPSSTPTRALLGDPSVHYERYVLASPRERLPLGIPQLVLHGDRDNSVSMRIATSYAAAARDAGDTCGSSCSHARVTSSTSTRTAKRGTLLATGSSLR